MFGIQVGLLFSITDRHLNAVISQWKIAVVVRGWFDIVRFPYKIVRGSLFPAEGNWSLIADNIIAEILPKSGRVSPTSPASSPSIIPCSTVSAETKRKSVARGRQETDNQRKGHMSGRDFGTRYILFCFIIKWLSATTDGFERESADRIASRIDQHGLSCKSVVSVSALTL